MLGKITHVNNDLWLSVGMSVGKTDGEEIEMYFQGKLSAFTETGQAELSIEVPNQRSYTRGSPAIPCSLADTPCATLGVQGGRE